jgi:UDP-N-acetylmuramate--alanine ligase
MSFFDYKHYYLVGIKGVAMTSLAQLLLDAGKNVSGSDVPEAFVTEKILSRLPVQIDTTFEKNIPEETECVIYTAAHQGKFHPQVKQAQEKNIPVYSHAEALSFFFNEKKGIAVCGVGGKSTVSAMISWILEKTGNTPSFSVGVGDVIGLHKTGQWHKDSQYFVAEADEYVTDPAAIQQGETAVPRFSYLQPFITVCTHLEFDHPDVYRDENHTFSTFNTFFSQIKTDGTLIINENDSDKVTAHQTIKTFGSSNKADLQYFFNETESKEGVTKGSFIYQEKQYEVILQVPGVYNLENAAAAVLASLSAGVTIEDSIAALASFRSTSRRFEKIGEWNGVPLYDDYAHHPSEIEAVLAALKNWYQDSRKVVAFQPHTYSRTKSLFNQFVTSFKDADVVLLLDIFASAREAADPTITTTQLVEAVKRAFPDKDVRHVTTPESLAMLCKDFLEESDVLLTIGAGDIYKVYQYLQITKKPTSTLHELFAQQFPSLKFMPQHPLAPYTTVKIGGPAELFTQINSRQDLIDVILFANSKKVPITMLGWGANSLIADRGIKGLVIKNICQTITIHDEETTEHTQDTYQTPTEARWSASKAPEAPSYEFTDLDYDESSAEKVLVTMDSGVSLPAAINTLLAKGITGLQWYSRIPASVGGAIYNNIHGGTHFIGEVLTAVDVLTEKNELQRYTVDQLELDYDFSRFHHSNDVILSGEFLLYKGDVKKAQAVAFEWAKRKHIQPQNSLGCIFQNISPEEQQLLQLATPSIGFIIQHLLKLQGYREGNAQVSLRHAAFIENLGSATAADYLSIIKKINTEAKEKLGLTLHTEIFFLGFTEDELKGIVHSRSLENTASA